MRGRLSSRFEHIALLLVPMVALRAQSAPSRAESVRGPDTVIVHSGSLALRALL